MKTFNFDPAKSYEENYKDLEKHHIEETKILHEKIKNYQADIILLGKRIIELELIPNRWDLIP